MTIAKDYPHSRWVIGRNLIRTFLASATKEAAISSRAETQARLMAMPSRDGVRRTQIA